MRLKSCYVVWITTAAAMGFTIAMSEKKKQNKKFVQHTSLFSLQMLVGKKAPG